LWIIVRRLSWDQARVAADRMTKSARYEANLQPGFKVSVKGKRRGGVRARARLNPSAAGLVALRVRGYSLLTVVLNSSPGDRPPEIYG
jgi:hypothetical protein